MAGRTPAALGAGPGQLTHGEPSGTARHRAEWGPQGSGPGQGRLLTAKSRDRHNARGRRRTRPAPSHPLGLSSSARPQTAGVRGGFPATVAPRVRGWRGPPGKQQTVVRGPERGGSERNRAQAPSGDVRRRDSRDASRGARVRARAPEAGAL